MTQSMKIEGGLFPAELLGRIDAGDPDIPGIGADTYGLQAGESVRRYASRSWAYLLETWRDFRTQVEAAPDTRRTEITRQRWLLVLLRELGFDRLTPTPAGGIFADETGFPVSHTWQDIPVHLLGWGTSLDRRTERVAGAARSAPQAMVQRLLNVSDKHLWALLSNGAQLRVLHDSTTLVGSAYLEFDLEAIFDGELYSDFVRLYLVCHASRFAPQDPDVGPASCWLERWRGFAADQGVRALDKLRGGVEEAISLLGTGFLDHPANVGLRERLRSRELPIDDLNRALLRTVYRLLFWFVAEDRGVLLDTDGTAEVVARYDGYYSSARLRRLALRYHGNRHHDLWESARLVFDALGTEGGCPPLGLPGIGGLFEPGALDEPLDGARLPNHALLGAVRALAVVTTRDGSGRRTVDFRNLGAEELGSVYEGLLELHPRYDDDERTYSLESLAGHERKTTGSYYTPSSLVECLLDSALDPLLDEAAAAPDPVAALLDLTVCDLACGSGHFLIAAARRIAKRVAAAESSELEPPPEAVRAAMRRVVGRCVYGVDVNPMAAELAKVSLWLEAMEPGRPLSFLDASIRVGNSLLGTTPKLLADGIPDAAFTRLEGDESAVVTSLKRQNAAEHLGVHDLFTAAGLSVTNLHLAKESEEIAHAPLPRSLADVHVQERRARELDAARARAKLVADAWCAAFVQPKTAATRGTVVTQAVLERLHEKEATLDLVPVRESVEEIARDYRFFHWHLEFPHIFRVPDANNVDPATGWTGGFSCVLGNPPWDTLSPDRKEFFSVYEPKVRVASKSEQDALVSRLIALPEVPNRWQRYRRRLYSAAHFIRNAGRYHLFAPGNLGKGDFNTYRIFVETAMQVTRAGGCAAQVVPGGFYGGANAMAIRRELLEHWHLRTVLGFVNAKKYWFDGVHAGAPFATYSARRGGSTTTIDVAFDIRTSSDLARATGGGTVTISKQAIKEQSPSVLAIPEIAKAEDLAVVDRISRRWPRFGDNTAGPPLRRYQREIDMGNDRGLFGEYDDGLPLYEGRMIGQYDHRAKAWRSGRGRVAVWEELPFGDPRKAIVPQWRVRRERVPAKVGNRVDRYRIGFGDVTSPLNVRSLIAALIPPATICGHIVPTITFSDGWAWAYMPWLAFANSFCLDFLIRKKVSLHVSYAVLDGIPIPRLPVDDGLVQRLGPLALRLTCTSSEMTGYWNEMAAYGWCEAVPDGSTPPGFIDEATRTRTRAEIDAIVALEGFGLSRDDFGSIIDTFLVLKRREERLFGEFRTKRSTLDVYDAMAEAIRTGRPYQTILDPQPGQGPRHPARPEGAGHGR